MNKYEQYKQDLIQLIVRKKIDAFDLVDYIVELYKMIDYLNRNK